MNDTLIKFSGPASLSAVGGSKAARDYVLAGEALHGYGSMIETGPGEELNAGGGKFRTGGVGLGN